MRTSGAFAANPPLMRAPPVSIAASTQTLAASAAAIASRALAPEPHLAHATTALGVAGAIEAPRIKAGVKSSARATTATPRRGQAGLAHCLRLTARSTVASAPPRPSTARTWLRTTTTAAPAGENGRKLVKNGHALDASSSTCEVGSMRPRRRNGARRLAALSRLSPLAPPPYRRHPRQRLSPRSPARWHRPAAR